MMKQLLLGGLALVAFMGSQGITGNDGPFPMGDVVGEWKGDSGVKVLIWPLEDPIDDDNVMIYVRVSDSNGRLLGEGVSVHNLRRVLFRATILDTAGKKLGMVLRAVPAGKRKPFSYKLEMKLKYIDGTPPDGGIVNRGTVALVRDSD